MEKETYLHQLGKGAQVSVGLAAYVKYVLTAKTFPAKNILRLDQSGFNLTSLLSRGSARLYLENDENQDHTLLFLQQNTFISLERNMQLSPADKLYFEFLEESEIMMVPDEHIANLFKLFPEFFPIQNHLNLAIKQTLLNHQLQLSVYDSSKRYDQFLIHYAHIALICEQKKIASYLGIDPKTLSRLRGKSKRR